MSCVHPRWTVLLGLMIAGLRVSVRADSTFGESQRAVPPEPAILNDVGIDQKLGNALPGDLTFRDESGRAVRLSDYFGKRPVILTLVYYKCPMLCTMVLNDLTKSLNAMNLSVGEDFDIITVSFDPRETSALATEKKRQYINSYRRPHADAGWHFLTGPESSIQKLAQACGFRYAWDAPHQVYAHASGIMVLTPDGKLARYFFGIDYMPSDLRLSLEEASNRTIGSPVDAILLYCFHYDPRTGRYGLMISRALEVGGAITLVLVGGGISLMLRAERRKAPFPNVDIGSAEGGER